jgi:hypothetical protein
MPIRVQANGPFEDQEIDVRSWDSKPYVPQEIARCSTYLKAPG